MPAARAKTKQDTRPRFVAESPVVVRLKRAAFRLEMAQLERAWAVISAQQQGMSVRDIAACVGLGATRVHQILKDPAAAVILQGSSVLRELGWPAPEDPPPNEPGMRTWRSPDDEAVADRLVDEAALLVTCAEWLEQLASDNYPPVINLRPTTAWPHTSNVAVDRARIVRVMRRIAADIDELARARRVADLSSAEADADPVLRHRRRLAEPPITFPKGPHSVLQYRQAWEAYVQQHAEAGLPLPENPFRLIDGLRRFPRASLVGSERTKPKTAMRATNTARKAPRPKVTHPKTVPQAASRMAHIALTMRLENNSKFGRGRKRAREVIEREYLAVYSVERICLDQAHCEYELHVPYRDHTELEHLVMALWKAMGSAADDHDCFIDEVEFTDKATGRCW